MGEGNREINSGDIPFLKEPFWEERRRKANGGKRGY